MRDCMTIRVIWICIAVCGLLTGVSWAQLPQTRLYVIAPCGGQSGSQVDVTIESGDDLEEVSQLMFSHPGITAIHAPVPEGAPASAARTFTVRIAKEVPPGTYEVTCRGRFGDSNPRQFVVGIRPEMTAPATNQTSQTACAISVGKVVHGGLKSAQEVDWYQFVGKQGERIVLDCWAERIDSRLKPVLSIYDATGRRKLASASRQSSSDPVVVFDVPADGIYLVKLHDATYRNGADYRYRLDVHTAPHIEFAVPSILTAGTTSRVTLYGFNLPAGTRCGQRLREAELESIEVDITAPQMVDAVPEDQRVSAMQAACDGFHYRYQTEELVSNSLRFGLTTHPVVEEQEPNEVGENAQIVSLPSVVSGSFAKVNDLDRFRFQGQAGQKITIDVASERMGFAADPVLSLHRVVKQADQSETLLPIIDQDDNSSNLNPGFFETQTSDPTVTVTLPEAGLYQITLQDRYWETRGDISLGYQMSVRECTPDFRVVAVPGSHVSGQVAPVGLRQRDRYPITLYLFRKDGFDGDVIVRGERLPDGLNCPETVIRSGTNSVCLMVSTDADLLSENMALTLTAQANIATGPEKTISTIDHPVRMATVVWGHQGSIPAECRLSSKLTVSVQKELAPCHISSPITELDAFSGSMLRIPVIAQRAQSAGETIQLSVQESPAAMVTDLESNKIAAGANEHELRLILNDDIAPGPYSVWIRGESIVSYRRNPEAADRMKLAVEKEGLAVEHARNKATEAAKLIADADQQLEAAMKKVQEQQAAVTKALQLVSLTQTAIEKLTVVQREAADRLLTAEQSLARCNQQLAQTQSTVRAQEERRAAGESSVKQAYQQIADAQGHVIELAAGVSLDDEAELALDVAESQVKSAESKLLQEVGKYYVGRWALGATNLQLKNMAARQQLAMSHHNELFQAHEAARQGLAIEKQKLLDSEAAHRAAVQVLMAMQKLATAAEASRAAAVTAEQSAQESLEQHEEVKRRVKARANDAAKAAEPRPLMASMPSPRITINVLPSPIKATLTLVTTGTVRGAEIPVKCEVQRLRGFTGTVLINVSDPETTGTVTAEPLRLDSDETSGTLTLKVPADAASGSERTVVLKMSAQTDEKDCVIERPLRISIP